MFKFVVLASLVAVSLARPQGPPATHQLKGHQLEKKVHAVPIALGHVPLKHPAPAGTVHTAPLLILAIPDSKVHHPVNKYPQPQHEYGHHHDHEQFRHHDEIEESEEFGSDEEGEEEEGHEGGHERIHHDW